LLSVISRILVYRDLTKSGKAPGWDLLAPDVCPNIGTMTDETGYGVLTDAQWAELAPLIEQCRPPHKTEHKNLRRTIEAIIWRHENGAEWRSIPPHLGPWWMAAQTFIRWSHHGVWERLLEQAQQRKGIKRRMAFLESMAKNSGTTS
jgi:transposase